MKDLRVMVVATDLLVRAGLATVLNELVELRVVGQASPTRFVEDLEVFQPDAVVWEADWQPRLPAAAFERPLVLLLQSATTAISRLPDNSTFALLPRDSSPRDILAALNAVMRGLIVIAPAYLPLLNNAQASDAPTAPLEALTPREREVLQLLAQGLTNKAIGQALGITEHTVKFHVNAIMGKVGAQSRTEAVIRATRAGWLSL